GLVGELLEYELRLLELTPADFTLAQADRIDRRLRSLGEVEHFIELDQAGRVVAIREQDDRLAADVGSGRRLDLLQFLQRDVDRVVERRRAVRRGLADRLF